MELDPIRPAQHHQRLRVPLVRLLQHQHPDTPRRLRGAHDATEPVPEPAREGPAKLELKAEEAGGAVRPVAFTRDGDPLYAHVSRRAPLELFPALVAHGSATIWLSTHCRIRVQRSSGVSEGVRQSTASSFM